MDKQILPCHQHLTDCVQGDSNVLKILFGSMPFLAKSYDRTIIIHARGKSLSCNTWLNICRAVTHALAQLKSVDISRGHQLIYREGNHTIYKAEFKVYETLRRWIEGIPESLPSKEINEQYVSSSS